MDDQKRKSDPILTFGIGTRIDAIMKKVGGPKSLANMAGISESQLYRLISGESQGKIENIAAIARAGDVSIDWLAFGRESVAVNEGATPYDVAHDYAPALNSVMQRLAFKREWIEGKGLKNTDLIVVKINDDAMSPTISPGWITLVDCRPANERPTTDGIYALMWDGQPRAKRLQPDLQGGVWVRNDNKAYTDQHMTKDQAADLHVIGRIIWIGGEI